MNYHLLFLATCLLTAVVAGCRPSRPDIDRLRAAGQADKAKVDAGADRLDKRVVALVSWLKRKGVTLELAGPAAEGHTGWRVTHPKTSDDYEVTFSIRSFPSGASEEQMREALDVNLAYRLNAPARLAMSLGGVSETRPGSGLPKSEDELPKVNGLPLTKAVQRLFREYEARADRP